MLKRRNPLFAARNALQRSHLWPQDESALLACILLALGQAVLVSGSAQNKVSTMDAPSRGARGNGQAAVRGGKESHKGPLEPIRHSNCFQTLSDDSVIKQAVPVRAMVEASDT